MVNADAAAVWVCGMLFWLIADVLVSSLDPDHEAGSMETTRLATRLLLCGEEVVGDPECVLSSVLVVVVVVFCRYFKKRLECNDSVV